MKKLSIKHIFFLKIAIFIFVSFCQDMYAAKGAELTAREKMLFKKVKNIYIERGDYLEVIPELSRQLQLPIVAELGTLTAPPKEADRGGRDDFSYFQKPVKFPCRMIGPFTFDEGVAIEAVDAFCCTLRKDFYWEVRNGIICIYRTRKGNERFNKFLQTKIPNIDVDKMPLQEVVSSLNVELNKFVPKLPEDGYLMIKPLSIRDVGYPFYLLSDIASIEINLHLKDVTVRDFLDKLILEIPSSYWVAFLETPGAFYADSYEYSIYISSYATPRSKFTLIKLLEGVSSFPLKEKRYGNYKLLPRDFRNELKRRYYSDPESFISELKKSNIIDFFISKMNTVENDRQLYDPIMFLYSLKDKRITEMIIQKTLNLKDPEKRLDAIELFIPLPFDFNNDKFFFKVWKNIAEDNKNPFQLMAKEVIRHYNAYYEFLRNQIIKGRRE